MTRSLAGRFAATARRRAEPSDAVVRERLRIVRELHDLVAHDLSVMTLGVGAGRVIMDKDPERARQTLREAEESGRRALIELQRMMGLLRLDPRAGLSDETRAGLHADFRADCPADGLGHSPQPRLTDLPALLVALLPTGLAVTLTEEGLREPGSVLELSAYRIVEEALLNAARHGHARTAAVALRWHAGILDLTVRDDGAPREGLIGAWERAALFGGSVSSGQTPHGFEVRVRLLLGRRG